MNAAAVTSAMTTPAVGSPGASRHEGLVGRHIDDGEPFTRFHDVLVLEDRDETLEHVDRADDQQHDAGEGDPPAPRTS